MGFVLARLQYLSINGIFLNHTIPSDAVFYAKPGAKRVGIVIHLATILPAGFLVVFQFIPVIRYKALLFHRINGYIVIVLLFLSTAGALIITPTAAGGYMATQVSLGFLGAITIISASLAYFNISRLRIDLHREWMIRTWVYAGSIITLRIIQHAAFSGMMTWPARKWFEAQSCTSIQAQYAFFGVPPQSNLTQLLYPACADLTQYVAVPAVGQGPENASARLNVSFGMALWLALILHAMGVEIYFRFTRAESERLKQLSIERRAKRGWSSEESLGTFNDIPKAEN